MTATARLLVILGPSASGKSALALSVAQHIGAEILSVDSMTVYRGMDTGTAKPSREEQHRVKHHLIDVVDPDQEFTVARFVELADAVIADCAARHKPLIAVGGTPLYYKSLFEGLFDGPQANAALRESFARQPAKALHAKLSEVDPHAAARIHLNDRKRLVRALEVFELTGRTISEQQVEWTSGRARHDATWFGLNWDREELNRRINARTRQMMDAGWLDETRELMRRHGSLSKTASQAAGYEFLVQHLNCAITLDEAIEQIKISTRQLARRQIKWFRRFPQVKWLDAKRPLEELVNAIL